MAEKAFSPIFAQIPAPNPYTEEELLLEVTAALFIHSLEITGKLFDLCLVAKPLYYVATSIFYVAY